MINPLEPNQLTRIESVHRGFLYQHLYAVGCLLLAVQNQVRSVIVEFDEDVELELENGNHVYIQVKTRLEPLVLSDIAKALERFDRLRLEHQEGRRGGLPSFVIVSNAVLGPGLSAWTAEGGLGTDVSIIWPKGAVGAHIDVPPAWPSVAEAIEWCSNKARQLPMSLLEPDTLVWKLAGRVQHASMGQAPGHSFSAADLHVLFEQLVVQLQRFPSPPDIYRPLENEPVIENGQRVRIVTGFSGAGKTAWASYATVHLGSECAYYDVGDLPGPSIATVLVRELAAQWAAPTAGGLRQVLLPGASGLDLLRALDRFLEQNAVRAVVVLDNAHRVASDDLRLLIDATRHLQFILLAQPGVSITELEAVCDLRQEVLSGWGVDQAAAEASEQGARASASDLGRLLSITGGLPLYVRSATQLSVSQYDGDVAAMCTAIEAQTNLERTRQETVLARSFNALPEDVRNCLAVLSLSDVPLSIEEAVRLVGATFAITAQRFAALIRQLRPLGVVRLYGGQQLQIHDAYRILGLARLSELPQVHPTAARKELKEIITESFERQLDHSRFPLFIRTLVELGDLEPLIEIATEEWFHEMGITSGIWETLEAASTNHAIDAKQRFYALDGLVFAEMKLDYGDPGKIERWIGAMEGLLVEPGLGEHERVVLLIKRMMFSSAQGDEKATRETIAELDRLTPNNPEFRRIFRYNTACALYKIGDPEGAEAIVQALVVEYYDLLGLDVLDVMGATNAELFERIDPNLFSRDIVKHLGDALDMVARTCNAQGKDSKFARIHAAKFYCLAGAVDSLIKVSQDLVDEFVGRSDYVGARQVIEQNLLPVILEYKMLGKLVSARSQYAVVLAYCGEYDLADAELDRLNPFRPGLNPTQIAEIENQRKFVAELRTQEVRPSMVNLTPAYLRTQTRRPKTVGEVRRPKRVKIGRNDPCQCGSGFKYKRCHGA